MRLALSKSLEPDRLGVDYQLMSWTFKTSLMIFTLRFSTLCTVGGKRSTSAGRICAGALSLAFIRLVTTSSSFSWHSSGDILLAVKQIGGSDCKLSLHVPDFSSRS